MFLNAFFCMKNLHKYWIAVISKDHSRYAAEGGFIQLSHGKEAPLKRLHAGDWVMIYSSKISMESKEKCQSFTAIGQVIDEDIYVSKMSETFSPYRKKIHFYPCAEAPITPMIDSLSFIKNKKSWGYPFRFGFFEIDKEDFLLIAKQMADEAFEYNEAI